jgi:miniconductance mechanosensitive channel
MFELIDQKLIEFSQSLGILNSFQDLFASVIKLMIAGLFSYLAFIISKRYIIKLLTAMARNTKSNWDDILIERKVFNRLAYLVPAYLLYLLIPFALTPYPEFSNLILQIIKIYSVVMIMLVGSTAIGSLLVVYLVRRLCFGAADQPLLRPKKRA